MAELVTDALLGDIVSMAGDTAGDMLDIVGKSQDPPGPSGFGWNSQITYFMFNGSGWQGVFKFHASGGQDIAFGLKISSQGREKIAWSGTVKSLQFSPDIEFSLVSENDVLSYMALLGGIIPTSLEVITFPHFNIASDVLTAAKNAYYAALVNRDMTNCSNAASKFRSELIVYKALLSQWNGTTGETIALYKQIKDEYATLKGLGQAVADAYALAVEDDKPLRSPFPPNLPLRVNSALSMVGISVPGFAAAANPIANPNTLADRAKFFASVQGKANGLSDDINTIQGLIRDAGLKLAAWAKLTPEQKKAQKPTYDNAIADLTVKLQGALHSYNSDKAALADLGVPIDTATGKAKDVTKAVTTTVKVAAAMAKVQAILDIIAKIVPKGLAP